MKKITIPINPKQYAMLKERAEDLEIPVKDFLRGILVGYGMRRYRYWTDNVRKNCYKHGR